MAHQSEFEENDLYNDLFWPFRAYLDVNDFISRVTSASLTLTLTGFILSNYGVSPGITGAIGMLGLAITFSEVILRILLNLDIDESPLDSMGVRRRVTGFFIYSIVGFILFITIGAGTPGALFTSIVDYILGLGVTFWSGAVFMRVFTVLEELGAQPSVKILLSVAATLATVFVTVLVVPEVATVVIPEEFYQIASKSPQEMANESRTALEVLFE